MAGEINMMGERRVSNYYLADVYFILYGMKRKISCMRLAPQMEAMMDSWSEVI